MATEFKPFEKIARLSTGCVISEKIDGTNASIYVGEDGEFLVGSRTRWITPEDDNFGFARWAYEREQDLRRLGPGHHFGEWWGLGIQRKYGMTEKRFSLFNSGRWLNSPDRPECCGVVPVLYAGAFNAGVVDDVMAKLLEGGSVAAPGFMDPEGVVVWHTVARKLFKKTFDDRHKAVAEAAQ